MSDVFTPTVDPTDEQRLTPEELDGMGPRDPENANASTGVEIHCHHCGRDDVMQSKYSKTMCVDCYMAYVNRNTVIKVLGDPNWKERAAQAGLNLWDQMPGESNRDYQIFQAYMGLYPAERPTLRRTAQVVGLAYPTVTAASRRGHFSERLDAWIHECDRLTMHQRRNEMIEMNTQHIKMAKKLRAKLNVALDMLQPEQIGPRDIVSLTKLAKDMEREARVDTIAQEEIQADLAKSSESKELQKKTTSQGDLGEVLSVLMKSGALGDVGAIGLRTTEDKHGRKTQELVVQKPGRSADTLVDVTDVAEVTDGEE